MYACIRNNTLRSSDIFSTDGYILTLARVGRGKIHTACYRYLLTVAVFNFIFLFQPLRWLKSCTPPSWDSANSLHTKRNTASLVKVIWEVSLVKIN